MPNGTGEITIERSLEQIQQGIRDIGTASRSIDKDLRDVQKNLRLDPSNTELLAERQSLLARQLENSRNRSEELSAAIAELNRLKQEQGYQTDGQVKLEAQYTQQLKETERQITALTGAIDNQSKSQEIATVTTKTFSQSMTEFQSNLQAVNKIMGGVKTGFELLGGDKDSGMGKALEQGQKIIQMMSGIMSMNKFLGASNNTLANTFNKVAFAAGIAISGYSIGTSIINAFGEENRKTVATIMIVTGALVAASIAAAALMGFTRPWMLPVAAAAIGVAAAGIVELTKTSPLGDSTVASISTPTVPTVSPSTTGGDTYSTQTTGDTNISINIYDASQKQTSEIINEINTYFRDKKLTYR